VHHVGEHALSLFLGQGALVRQLALHMVCAVFSTRDFSRFVQDHAFTLLLVIAPLSIVDGASSVAQVAAMTVSAVAVPVADVDVAGLAVDMTPLVVHFVLLPLSFVDRAVKLYEFALAFT